MTGIDWTECTLIETVPGKMSGAPVLRGTRVRPEDLLVNRDEGIDWLVENFDIPADVIRRLFAFHDQHLRPTNRFQPCAVAGELAIRAAVLTERKERRVPIRRQSDVNGRVHFMLQVAYPIPLAYLAVDPLDRAELFT